MSKTAEELRRQRESQKFSFKEAQMEKSAGTGRTVQSPQSQRSYLKETQMAKQDNAAQYQAAPASSVRQYGSAAANATLSFLNQNGVSTKYTQGLMQPQEAPKQTNPQYQNAATNATLSFLNQNGVSTKYTQDLMQPQTAQAQTAAKTDASQPDTQAFAAAGKEWKHAILQESSARNEEEIQRELDQAVRNWEAINPGYAVTPEQAASMETSKKAALEQVNRLRQEQKLFEEQQKLYAAAASNRIKKYERSYIQKYAGTEDLRQSVDQLTAQLDQTTDRRAKAQLQAEIDWLKPYADYQWNINYDVEGAKAKITELDRQIANKQRDYQMLAAGGSSPGMLTEMREAIETLEAERNRLYQESYFAELIQTDASYRALMDLPDFAEYSRAGANLRNGQYDNLWDSLSGIDTSYYEMANPAKAMREEKTGSDTSYLYMTEEE